LQLNDILRHADCYSDESIITGYRIHQ
jgi:hypothetical protein